MNLEELLFARYNIETYIKDLLLKENNNNKRLLEEINNKILHLNNMKNKMNESKNMFLGQVGQLKQSIEQTKDEINKLILEKNSLKNKNNKEEFLEKLDKEIKEKLTTPDFLFKELTQGKINFNEFNAKFKELTEEGNYYYYKVIAEKLKETN